MSKNFSNLGQGKLLQGCQNCIPLIQRNLLGTNCFEKLNIFFRTAGEKISAGLLKLHSMSPENVLGFGKKREHVHIELANYGEKCLRTDFYDI